MNCLSVFDHFVGLILKWLKIKAPEINPCDVPVTFAKALEKSIRVAPLLPGLPTPLCHA